MGLKAPLPPLFLPQSFSHSIKTKINSLKLGIHQDKCAGSRLFISIRHSKMFLRKCNVWVSYLSRRAVTQKASQGNATGQCTQFFHDVAGSPPRCAGPPSRMAPCLYQGKLCGPRTGIFMISWWEVKLKLVKVRSALTKWGSWERESKGKPQNSWPEREIRSWNTGEEQGGPSLREDTVRGRE